MSLTHFDEQGASRMVDTSAKSETVRIARASGQVQMQEETWRLIQNHSLSKGNVIEVARLAGIMAAKQTGQLIPLCHPLPLTGVSIDFSFVEPSKISITAEAKVVGRTGVEMEALTAVSVAALTIYDMCKSYDKSMVISQIQLDSKSGGKSGDWQRSQ
ncbi:MAG: cyclic pyranopterin monophosphate synthase MoaC [Planctomycetia bacterium]|nr:cyclic pyranopterin monophosphate synthase MoaC [Planctomycetia bacterium]